MKSRSKYILILSILINICFFIYIFNDIEKKDNIYSQSKIDSLELNIKNLEDEKKVLKISLIQLQNIADSLNVQVGLKKSKIIKIIEYRDKENIIIKSIPDGELFELFSKFDSLSHKNR